MTWLLMLLLLEPGLAAAKKTDAKKKAAPPMKANISGSSQMPAADFIQCVQDSLLGRTTGECENKSDSDACVGFKLALDYSRMHSDCRTKQGEECTLWAHKQHTEFEWTAVAAGHLSNFSSCVRDRYGSDASNGLSEAKADSSFVDLLKKIDDGSHAWGLQQSQVVLKRLDGETLAEILSESPFAKGMPAERLYGFREATENPLALRYESGPDNAFDNPASGEVGFRKLAKSYLESAEASDAAEGAGSASLAPKEARAPAALVKTESPAKPSLPTFIPSRRPRELYGLNLDRTLFELVNDAYVRHAAEMKGTDEFVREQKMAPAQDVSELLQKGETL